MVEGSPLGPSCRPQEWWGWTSLVGASGTANARTAFIKEVKRVKVTEVDLLESLYVEELNSMQTFRYTHAYADKLVEHYPHLTSYLAAAKALIPEAYGAGAAEATWCESHMKCERALQGQYTQTMVGVVVEELARPSGYSKVVDGYALCNHGVSARLSERQCVA